MKMKTIAYVGERRHERGVRKMTARGWIIQATVSSVPRSGCLSMLFLGLLFRKKSRFVVTYMKP
jgi:hypothetical protein